jgi:DNA-binding MarR family transcriptional regulator
VQAVIGRRGEEMNEKALLERWRELDATHAVVRESLERALERKHQLSLSEYEVLRHLSAAPEGHLRMQELAEEIHLSQSALSRLVKRLEEEGLATRGVCEHDRRGVWACITDRGRAAQRKAEPTHLAALGETLRGRDSGRIRAPLPGFEPGFPD